MYLNQNSLFLKFADQLSVCVSKASDARFYRNFIHLLFIGFRFSVVSEPNPRRRIDLSEISVLIDAFVTFVGEKFGRDRKLDENLRAVNDWHRSWLKW